MQANKTRKRIRSWIFLYCKKDPAEVLSSSPTGHAEISISPQLYKWEKLSVPFSVQLLFSVGSATTAEFVTVTAGSKNNVRLETKKRDIQHVVIARKTPERLQDVC